MANPKHVKMAKQGRAAIAEWWRQRHRDERLDLDDADLHEADLREANLRGAHLAGANLSLANLSLANLRGANLSGADLRRAHLDRTDLSRADLSGADLSDAMLDFARLRDTELRDANLHQTKLFETIFADIDLSGVFGLESLFHAGPSVIDERTLRKSWPLPEAFLRGVGLSNRLIEHLPGLYGQAIDFEFYSCFISYSSKDQEFARRLHADLQEIGVRCWFASEDLKSGDPFRDVIDRAIRLHDKLLLILSRNSVQSPWVKSEVEAALERESRRKRTALFPIRIDDAVMRTRQGWAADVRRKRHIGDFRRWKDHDAYQQAFERLLRDLKPEGKVRR